MINPQQQPDDATQRAVNDLVGNATVPDAFDKLADGATIDVGSRRFRPCQHTTFEQDLFIMKISAESGLDRLAQTFDGESDKISDFSERLILQAYGSGQLWLLLAACTVEVSKAWSVESAYANAEYFRTLTRTEDKLALRNAIVAVIVSFFVKGLFSKSVSTSSSSAAKSGSESSHAGSPAIDPATGSSDDRRSKSSESSSADATTSDSGTK